MMDELSILTAFLAMAAILCGCYFATRLLAKRMLPGFEGRSGRMKVLDCLTLGPNKSLAIVKIGGRFLLLGIAAEQISLLTELTEEELDTGVNDGDGAKGGFSEILRRQLGKYSGKKDDE